MWLPDRSGFGRGGSKTTKEASKLVYKSESQSIGCNLLLNKVTL